MSNLVEFDKKIKETLATAIEESADRLRNDKIELKAPSGKKVVIVWPEIVLVRKLQDLPADMKIKLMCLRPEDMEKHIFAERYTLLKWLKELEAKKWYWRESGDAASLADFEAGMIPGLQCSGKELSKLIKSRNCKMSIDEMHTAINFFTGDTSEIYTKEE